MSLDLQNNVITAVASRQAVPGGGSHWGGRCCARLPCGARPGVASRDSLRSLRSLRSNSRDESEHEARCARRPLGCAPRRPRDRRRLAPPATTLGLWYSLACWARTPEAHPQRRVGTGRSAPLQRRGAQGLRPSAQRGSSTCSSRLFERSERREFRDAAARPRTAEQSTRSATAAVKHCALCPRVFAPQCFRRIATGCLTHLQE